jgi:hypothetical protein
MDEILPGVQHWTAFDEGLRTPVHSYYVEPAGALIDPKVPEEGIEALERFGTPPQQVVLTNHRHYWDADQFRRAFGCLVRINHDALDELRDKDVEPFWDGDEVAPGVTAVQIGVADISDETALHVAHGPGAIAFGDALLHPSAAVPLAYPADEWLGDHPDRTKKALKHAFTGLLLRDFDALLLTHGEPYRHHGKEALREFVEAPVGYPEYGPFA